MARYSPEMLHKMSELLALQAKVAEYRRLLARHASDQGSSIRPDAVNGDVKPS